MYVRNYHDYLFLSGLSIDEGCRAREVQADACRRCDDRRCAREVSALALPIRLRPSRFATTDAFATPGSARSRARGSSRGSAGRASCGFSCRILNPAFQRARAMRSCEDGSPATNSINNGKSEQKRTSKEVQQRCQMTRLSPRKQKERNEDKDEEKKETNRG